MSDVYDFVTAKDLSADGNGTIVVVGRRTDAGGRRVNMVMGGGLAINGGR